MSELDVHEVLKYLPHRYPFILVDKVLEVIPHESIVALKNVTINEPFFQGHFPHRPVMPGVLMLEALAQASAILAFKSEGTYPTEETLYYFAGADNVKFKRVVEPGDQLRLEVEIVKHKQGVWKVKGLATVDGEVACTADLTSAKRNII